MVPRTICGSDHTRLYRTHVADLEYFVIHFATSQFHKCGGCGSEFLNPRPSESELHPFYPSDQSRLDRGQSVKGPPQHPRILTKVTAVTSIVCVAGSIESTELSPRDAPEANRLFLLPWRRECYETSDTIPTIGPWGFDMKAALPG